MHPSIRQRQIALLIESLQRLNRTDERKNAAVELGQLGSIAASAVPQLVLAATDIDANVRAAAGTALTAIDPEWKKRDDVRAVAPLLIVKLGSSSTPVIDAAVRLLRQLGASSTPFLTAYLDENPHKTTCVLILQLLAGFGRAANVAVPAILKTIESQVVQVRLASAHALLRVADPQPEVIAALTTRLGDDFADVRATAAEALTSFGIAARAAIRRLLVLLTDREDKVRAAASAALESMGPAVAPALVEVLNTRDQERIRVWGDGLFQMFQVQPGWINLSGLRNISWTLADVVVARTNLELAHETALNLLAKFGSNASVALASISNTLKDPNPRVRLAGVNAIGSMGDEAAFAIPEIVPMLLDERSEIRVAAAKALSGIRDNWAEDSNVRAVLTTASGKIAVQAIETLVHGGSSSVPVLADFLNSSDRVVREQAAASLGRMGPNARGAIPHLEKALSDSHGWVQAAARTALQAITRQ